MTEVRFVGDVTLGNLLLWLPLLALLGTASVTLYRAGNFIQQFQDALTHEAETRTTGIITLSSKIDDLKVLQAQDRVEMKGSIEAVRTEVRQSVAGVRDDIRALIRPSR